MSGRVKLELHVTLVDSVHILAGHDDSEWSFPARGFFQGRRARLGIEINSKVPGALQQDLHQLSSPRGISSQKHGGPRLPSTTLGKRTTLNFMNMNHVQQRLTCDAQQQRPPDFQKISIDDGRWHSQRLAHRPVCRREYQGIPRHWSRRQRLIKPSTRFVFVRVDCRKWAD